ncbi:MAG: PEP-CTERM sorting domain-containing protein [Methylococcaceae bacterium]
MKIKVVQLTRSALSDGSAQNIFLSSQNNDMFRKGCKSLVTATLLCASLVTVPSFASTIYSQLPGSNSRDSHVDADLSDGSSYVFDYFVPTQSGKVSSISWQGSAQTNSGFTIQILNAKLPATPATPDTLASNSTVSTITLLNNNQALSKTSSASVIGLYNFSVDLSKLSTQPTPINLTAGNSYWISIYSTGTTAWNWSNGTGGDNFAEVYTVGTKQWQPLDVTGHSDMAFTLAGTIPAVPLPGSVWLLGSGLMGLLSFSWRKNKTANG